MRQAKALLLAVLAAAVLGAGPVSASGGKGGSGQPEARAVESYKGFLAKLDPTDPTTISLAAREYRRLFGAKDDTVSQDQAFEDWVRYYMTTVYHGNQSFGQGAHPDLWGDPATLKANGIQRLSQDGKPYLFWDASYVLDRFRPYISPMERDFWTRRGDEIRQGFTKDGRLAIPWDDLRRRIVGWEKYLDDYAVTPYEDEVDGLIQDYMTVYVHGKADVASDSLTASKPYPLPAGARESYEKFVKEDKKSQYWGLMKDYLAFLEKRRFMMDDKANKAFFDREQARQDSPGQDGGQAPAR